MIPTMSIGTIQKRATDTASRAVGTASALPGKVRRRLDARRIRSRVTLYDLEQAGWEGVRPAFVLSTGRSGTRLLSDLLEQVKGVDVHHAPRPELITASKAAFERIEEPGELPRFVDLLKAAREDMLRQSVRYGHRYVEPNCRITFLAPACDAAYPGSYFLHIVRHPAAIVRSGAERGWYSGRHDHDSGRIVPLPGTPEAELWAGWDPVDRIGWLWDETTRFVERFAERVGDGRVAIVRAEDLFRDAGIARAALAACGVDPLPADRVAKAIATPVNRQAEGAFPSWARWTDDQRARLVARCGATAARYGYDLADGSTSKPTGPLEAPHQRALTAI